MIAVLHVAGLASGRRGIGRENVFLLQIASNAVFRGRVHLPLRVIEAHVAGLTGLRRAGFIDREGVASVAGVALRRAEFSAGTVVAQFGNLGGAFVANLVAAAASLFALDHGHRLPVNRRHGLHRGPGHGVLASFELRDLGLVALGAGFRRGNFCLGHVGRGRVPVAVTGYATDFGCAVLAELPVSDDVGCDFVVALDALGRSGSLCGQEAG